MGFIISLVAFGALSSPAFLFILKYPLSAQWPAIVKAFFLWCVSTSPVVGGILLSKPASAAVAVTHQLNGQIVSKFPLSEMFVYSAAFLAPVLYVIFDIVKHYQEIGVNFNKDELFRHMRGMQGIIISSIFILLLTLLAYASEKSDPVGFSKTYMAILLTKQGYLIYIASLLIWYTVILWEIGPKQGIETKQVRDATKFAGDYAKRRTGQ